MMVFPYDPEDLKLFQVRKVSEICWSLTYYFAAPSNPKVSSY